MYKCYLLFGFILSPVFAFSQKNAKPSYPVTVRVFEVSSYCGGAELSHAEYRKISEPTPLANYRLILRCKGKILDSFISDKDGVMHLRLPDGRYELIQPYKSRPLKTEKQGSADFIDWKCIKAEWKKPDVVFEVKGSEVKDLKFTFVHYCPWNTPCRTYTGPMPP